MESPPSGQKKLRLISVVSTANGLCTTSLASGILPAFQARTRWKTSFGFTSKVETGDKSGGGVAGGGWRGGPSANVPAQSQPPFAACRVLKGQSVRTYPTHPAGAHDNDLGQSPGPGQAINVSAAPCATRLSCKFKLASASQFFAGPETLLESALANVVPLDVAAKESLRS